MTDAIQELKEQMREARSLGNKYVRLTVPDVVRLLNAIEEATTCKREHVPYEHTTRSQDRFFGDENNG